MNKDMKVIVYTNDELYHHGIKGQKHGKRNGPPYPLSGNAHSASEKKAGKKGWTKEARKEKLKKAGKIARAAVAGAAAAGGAAVGGMAINKKIKDSKTSKPDHNRVFDAEKGKVTNAKKSDSGNGKEIIAKMGKATSSKEGSKAARAVISGTTGALASSLRIASKTKKPTNIKPASQMSNKELQDFLTRKSLEERYEKYTMETKTNKKLETAANVLEDIGGLAITGLGAAYIYSQIKHLK